MAQPLIKFFRASAAPTEGLVQGAIWFNPSNNEIRVYNGTDWEKYSGLVKNVEYAEAKKTLTITSFEGDTTSLNLDTFVKGYIEALDYADTAVAGKYVSQVTQTNGKIEVTRADIPVKDVTAPDGTTIVEGNTAKLSKVQATVIGDTGSDNKFATEKAVRDAIKALDKDDTAVAGKYVSAVSEADGVITVTRADLPAESFTGVRVDGNLLTIGNDKSVNWGLNYDSTKKLIQVLDLNKGNAVLDSIDATAFIKDGMVDTASIVWCTIEDGKHVPHTTEVEDAIRCLQIVFNTDAGKEEIHIPLNELTDVYTGAKDEITVSDANEIGLATVTQTNNEKKQTLEHSTATDPDTFAAVTGVTVDTKGRVTGVEKTTFTMPKLDIAEVSKEGSDDYVKVTVATENGSVKSVAVNTDTLTTKISGIEADLTEVAQVTAAALVDLDSRLDSVEAGTITSVTGEANELNNTAYVNVKATTEKGAVTLASSVKAVEATKPDKYPSTGLATDGYVNEKVAGLSSTVLHGVTSEEETISVSERDAKTGTQNIELCWSGWAE